MNKDEVVSLARNLMRTHGVGHLYLKLTQRKRELGACLFSDSGKAVGIALSEPWIKILPEARIRDTILHEIAHALAGWDAQHGPDWQRMARIVGADAQRTAGATETNRLRSVLFKYRVTCPNPSCTHRVLDHIDRITPKYERVVCKSCRTPVVIRSNVSHRVIHYHK